MTEEKKVRVGRMIWIVLGLSLVAICAGNFDRIDRAVEAFLWRNFVQPRFPRIPTQQTPEAVNEFYQKHAPDQPLPQFDDWFRTGDHSIMSGLKTPRITGHTFKQVPKGADVDSGLDDVVHDTFILGNDYIYIITYHDEDDRQAFRKFFNLPAPVSE